jgi:hypothetical protein
VSAHRNPRPHPFNDKMSWPSKILEAVDKAVGEVVVVVEVDLMPMHGEWSLKKELKCYDHQEQALPNVCVQLVHPSLGGKALAAQEPWEDTWIWTARCPTRAQPLCLSLHLSFPLLSWQSLSLLPLLPSELYLKKGGPTRMTQRPMKSVVTLH